MTQEEKLILIAATLDSEQNAIAPQVQLTGLDEWDSMGIISVIAMLDKKFSKVLSAEQIETLKTVQDILDLMV